MAPHGHRAPHLRHWADAAPSFRLRHLTEQLVRCLATFRGLVLTEIRLAGNRR
jgi:hypothetical protein